MKGITLKICRLYVYVIIINKRSFEPFMCLDQNKNSLKNKNKTKKQLNVSLSGSCHSLKQTKAQSASVE